MPESTMTDTFAQNDRDRLVRQFKEIASLAGGLAHEVRNPISTIRLNLELLLEDVEACSDPTAHRMQRKVKAIQKECGHLEEVLEAFLQFTRLGELTLEESHISELIREYLESYSPVAEQNRIDILPHLNPDLPLVRIDRRLFRQLLDNLVRNAQQAMPQGGSVEIQAYQRDGQIMLEIIDTGTGIPPQAVPRIFDEFYSTKSSGTGLGLPTVRRIVEAHGGTIHCESEPGRGTRFTIALPFDQAISAH